MRFLEFDDVSVPTIGFGTWKLTGERCERVVRTALEVGYRHIDTAQMYENEDAVGRALEASGVPRDEVFVTTKLFLDDLTRERVPAALDQSLDRLRTDRIDLVLVHWPSPVVPLRETLDALTEQQESGRIARFGVSNFTPSLLDRAVEHAPVFCNQVEFHPYLSQTGLLDRCRRRGLLLTAYAPLAQGRVVEDPTIRAIAERHDATPAQVALRWLVQQGGVAAIPKASSREHLEENLASLDLELDPKEMSEISALDRGERLIDPEWAPEWERARVTEGP